MSFLASAILDATLPFAVITENHDEYSLMNSRIFSGMLKYRLSALGV